MGKPALVVRVAEFEDSLQKRPITTWAVMLANRDNCEYDQTLLQIIPYIVMRNTAGKVFTYVRGQSGNESRLHEKLSIGVGGHVDNLPLDCDIIRLLADEAAREIQEEVGIVVDVDSIDEQLRATYSGNCKLSSFIRMTGTPVDSVHLGIPLTVQIPDEHLTLEAGVVMNGTWLSIPELKAKCQDPTVSVENWSRALIESPDFY